MKNHYFLAIPVAEEIGEYLQRETIRLKESCSYRQWTDMHDYHITLFFFGPLPEEELEKVVGISTKISDSHTAFDVSISGIEGFGDKRHPRVVFAALAACPELVKIQSELKEALAGHGFIPDNRPYHSHITLAKGWLSGQAFDRRLEKLCSQSIGWKIDRIVLYAVMPGQIPHYNSIKIFSLGKSNEQIFPDIL
ncbi:RNA 2',3'-cyclic phosphodiesterase [Sporolactobacillus shoreae]|uniref:RNA 2',3'-cyclic phosphodiesterase n=1 Tax=Sporolactobacillus shoreae TaxID=1465501 RepID=A0A4Z0GRX7_9BACL|nr:RNA 2',3'-cyclic phosphodiesterase [Sporolactobacillus shoreae]TGA99220.1 RNA 2',3'-cyclic phosphodiesterase [Sporolactobacillus shoreae]